MRRDWGYPSKQWLEQARRLSRLAPSLPAMLRGEAHPDNTAERVDLALVASGKGLHAMAARLYAEAFAADPRLAEDLEVEHRYDAACSAVLAGCGKGIDQPPLDQAARNRLRRQALDWLGGHLDSWSRTATSGSPKNSPTARRHLVEKLEHWKHDPDLAGVRAANALKQLDQAEQAGWRSFWAEVDRILARSTAAPD
jgi:hypothetical protein